MDSSGYSLRAGVIFCNVLHERCAAVSSCPRSALASMCMAAVMGSVAGVQCLMRVPRERGAAVPRARSLSTRSAAAS